MIHYALICEKGHDFESWFQDSAAYDKQAKRGLVNCPHCGSAKIEKAIMAPRLAGAKKRTAPVETPAEAPAAAPEKAPVAMLSPQEQEFRSKLKELREHLTKNADHVGAKFPEEAQDALRRDRAPLDLWRGIARGSQGVGRGRHRIPPAADFTGRAELNIAKLS